MEDGKSSSKQKHKAFFLANKEKNYHWQYIIEHILPRVPPGEPKEQKSIKMKLSTTTEVMQSHFAGVRTSIPENEDQWADHRRKRIPEEYQTAA